MERKEFLHSLIKPSSSKKERHQRKAVITTMEIPEVVPPFSTGLDPYTGPWTETEIIHLLKRTMFGAAQEDVAYFKSRTVAQAVDELVNTVNANPGEPIKVAATDAASPASDPDWSIPIGRSWVSTGTSTNSNNGNRRDSLRSWWLGNMINQPRSIEEKMILFWSNHVTIEFAMVGGGLLCYGYMQLLRQHALGNFKILVKEMTINPAMLVYLNGYQNTKTAPDENYGRELQELFTVGKGPDSHYTEDDVKAAARVLTGYMVNLQNAYYSFAITKHDTEPKQFSSFYNNTVISRSQSEAQLEVDDLLNMIFSNVETSKNICRRLYRYFVYHEISPETEAAVITPLAETFRNNNYDIKPVLTQLLNSQHFFDTLQFGDTIKSPLDFTVGLIRECGVKLPPRSNPVLQYKHLNYLAANFMASIDQSIGDPNNVSGYMPYYQSPFYDKLWVNTDTFVKRQGFIDSLVNSGYSNGGFKTFIDPVAIASKMSSPANPNKLVQDFNTCFLRRSLSQGLRDTIKSEILLSGLTDDNYWTVAWNAYINNPSDLNNYSVVNTRLKALLLYFFSKLEEYHLM
ncbi:MAG: DUF1800 domain-containing protein [Chitinophagaceae bacterium]|nr:DUF1800 domain-containing protein [Chitinophagaceae bacterium]